MNIGHVQNYKIINCSWKINVLVLIRAYWWENWSEINKRTGTFIRNSRVLSRYYLVHCKIMYSGVSNKRTGMFINFWPIFPPVRPYLDQYVYFLWTINDFVLLQMAYIHKKLYFWANNFIPICLFGAVSQWAEADFNKILGTIYKTYPGLISILQGFQKCIAWNPSK